MWQAHSLLWHYLWAAPNVLLLALVCGLRIRGLHRRYRFFVAFAVASAIEQLVLYVLDLSPVISAEVWWRAFCAGLVVEGTLKFVLIGDIFGNVFERYATIARLGRRLIGGLGVVLIFGAAVAAAFAPEDSSFGIVSAAHLFQQTIYIVETGVLAAIFCFVAYFHIDMDPGDRGIAIGLAVSACVHLATWAVAANLGLPTERRVVLDFINMGTFHGCVLIWIYALLVAKQVSTNRTNRTLPPSSGGLPDNNLEVWNRELERLLQQ
jgi:hypothetical protein